MALRIRHTAVLLLGLVLVVVVTACGDVSEADIEATVEARVELDTASLLVPTTVPLPTYTPLPVTPTSETNSILAPWGLLVSLPVDLSAVLAAGPLLDDHIGYENDIELRTFTGFGMPKSGTPEVLSPQWEFAVPPGTPALAPVTGYVVAIHTLWSDDLSVWLSADGEESRVWEVEHVVDVLVEVGDFVEAGYPIATASVFGGRKIALVELGLFEGGRTPAHYCPLLYVDEDALSVINAELNKIRKENFDRLDSRGISIPVNDPDGQSCWTELPVFDSP